MLVMSSCIVRCNPLLYNNVTWYCFWEMEGMILLLHFHSALVPFTTFLICEQHDCYIHLVQKDILSWPLHVFLKEFPRWLLAGWLSTSEGSTITGCMRMAYKTHIIEHLWNKYSFLKNRALIHVQDSNSKTLSALGSLYIKKKYWGL